MSGLLPVDEAQKRLLALKEPLPCENIEYSSSLGRYLSEDVTALRDQPEAALSAMDGFAIRFGDLPGPWTIVGEVAAGRAPAIKLASGEAIRIFTGALLPAGADTVVIREDVDVARMRLKLTGEGAVAPGQHIRGRASDFGAGDRLLAAGSRLTPGAIAAAIMGGVAQLVVGSRPRVAILTTGDELVEPGAPLTRGQIPNSNGAMLAAMLAAEPVTVTPPLHIHDDRRDLCAAIKELARCHDVIVTVGGASVGDHDHVRGALADAGGHLEFWKIAMRPGKPLIAGSIGGALLLGLPGNPSSAFVTATLFLLPLLRHLAGARDPLPPTGFAPLACPLGPGGPRRHYMRARLVDGHIVPLDSQDSGQTLPLATAQALLVRETGAPAADAGDIANYIAIA